LHCWEYCCSVRTGHSFLIELNPSSFFSVGLRFTNAKQAIVRTPDANNMYTFNDPNTEIHQTTQINTEARVVFIGACDVGPIFKNLWNIQTGTTGHALIVPSTEEAKVLLGHAATYWTHLLFDLVVQHMKVQAAVTESNQWLISLGSAYTEQWQVIGDGNVTIN
jgi:hypothetical protein